MLAAASVNLMEAYDIRPDPKVEAAIGMAVAVGTVYGPRVISIRVRKNKERQERRAQSEVVDFTATNGNIVPGNFTPLNEAG